MISLLSRGEFGVAIVAYALLLTALGESLGVFLSETDGTPSSGGG